MSNISRTGNSNQPHPRLIRLDAEMMPRGSLPYQYLSAVHDGKRWIICVLKIADCRYAATVSTNHEAKNLVLRASEKTPSAAVQSVLRQLTWNLRQSPEAIKRMFPQMLEPINTRSRDELEKMRAKTVADIEAFSKKPGFVQAQFSNALEARLGRIDTLLQAK